MKPHANPWVTGDRVRVRDDCPHEGMRGKTGTVLNASPMSLGIPNDYNTSVELDDWPHQATPIFNDASLEAL